MQTRRALLKSALGAPLLSTPHFAANAARIRQVDIIHHSHTDVGYTDLPSVTRELQVRFLDTALDTCLKDRRFRWTCEAMLTVDDWWKAASAARRAALLGVIRTGQMDVMALPFNQAPFMNAEQWNQAFQWIPDALWRELNPQAAMQNDVNGFPRAGAIRLLNRGITHLLMGINADSGGPPFQRPSAFWWKMPDGRKLFVWLGDHYGTAYSFFEPKNWIHGQPKGADTTQRAPRAGDFLRTDEASLRAAAAQMRKRLDGLEAGGYPFERLILSFTNQWRYDNDPPFPPLPAFVEAWNKLSLQPVLRLVTSTVAVREMERLVGASVPTREGEWTDWWANGDASGPREVAASRFGKRSVTAALSPVWGEMKAPDRIRLQSILKDLCLFDEHTWGANVSIGKPDGLDTIGQYTEKSLLAYRPMAHAELLLSDRVRTRFENQPAGVYVTNTARTPYTGWVRFPAAGLRGEFASLQNPTIKLPLEFLDGKRTVRFWVQDLAPASTQALALSAQKLEPAVSAARPSIESDPNGWPSAIAWSSMKKPLFNHGSGDFVATITRPPTNRGTIAQMHKTRDAAKREEMRRSAFEQVPASYGNATLEDNPNTLVFRQPFQHPRLDKAVRVLEVWKREPRARMTLRFERISSMSPEVFYINFALPVEGMLPTFSNGGVPFVPYRDQLEGTCHDYFAIDGWAHYNTPDGNWLWVSRDAPLVSVGGPHTVERHTQQPADTHRLMAIGFDNCWHTNFVANSHGEMEFQFDLLWSEKLPDPARVADTLVSEPAVLVNV